MDENTELQQEETTDITETAETPDALQESDLPLHEQQVFGVPRFSFWGILFGYGGGLILCGIFGMITGIEIKNTLLPGIGGAAIGYFIGLHLTKKIKAQQSLQEKDSESNR